MKKQIILFVFAVMLLVLGCGKETEISSPSHQAMEKGMMANKPGGQTYYDRLITELEEIAQYLAQHRGEIAQSLPQRVLDREGEAPLSSLDIASSLPQQLQGREGRILEVTIALAQESPVQNLADQLRVTVDPDDYPTGESGTFTAYNTDASGNLVSDRLTVDAYNRDRPFPLLLIGTNQVCGVNCGGGGGGSGGGGGGGGPTPGPYLSVREIDLHKENDPVGYEEFEIYFREDEGFSAEWLDTCTGLKLGTVVDVKKTSNLIFDGSTTRKDAANRTRTWPDVNKDNGTYLMPQDIALIRLGTRKRGLTPIEDDDTKGLHVNNNNLDPCTAWLRVQDLYVYRHDLGGNQWDNDVLFSIANGGQDDVYTYSGIFGVTKNNYFESGRRYNNSDMALVLLRENVE